MFDGSKPHVSHAPRVAWQILEGNKTFEVVDWQVPDRLRFGHPEVHRHRTLAFLIGLEKLPESHASASSAEVILKVRSANVRLRCPGS
jgi:hypothetical protein